MTCASACRFLLFFALIAVSQISLLDQLVPDFIDVAQGSMRQAAQKILDIVDLFAGFD